MATDSPGAWALWFLMLGIYSIVTITFLFLGTICAALVTVQYVFLEVEQIDCLANLYPQLPACVESPL